MEKLYVYRSTFTRLINIALKTTLPLADLVQALLDYHSDDQTIIDNLKTDVHEVTTMTPAEILDREA